MNVHQCFSIGELSLRGKRQDNSTGSSDFFYYFDVKRKIFYKLGKIIFKSSFYEIFENIRS